MALRFFAHHPKRFRSDRGVAFVEASIILPIIAALIVGVVFISTYMQSHALMTNVANEGARFMARQVGLGEITPDPITELADLEPTTVPTGTGVAIQTHQHVINFLRAMHQRDRNFDIRNIRIITNFSDVEDRVRVSVSAEVQPYSFLPLGLLESIGWGSIRTSAQSVQPYLY